MVALSVGIRADHIHGSIAGVPISSHRVPDPQDVVDLVVVGDAVIDDAPQLLGRLGALGPPPEPLALGLVQRPEQDRDAGGLELLELRGDGVDVLDQQGVVGVRGVLQRGGDVEVRRRGVEARVPRLLGRVVQPDGRAPVPHEVDDATLGGEGDGLVDVCAGGPAGDAGLGVVHEVDAEDGGGLADVVGYPVERGLVLLSGEDVLPVDAAEVLEQGFGVGVGIGVDRCGGDLVWPSCRGRCQSDGVDEIPGL